MGKNRSKDFRYVFANAFSLRFGDNDTTLTLGIDEGNGPENMLEEVAVVMTPKTLKILTYNVQQLITRFEKDVGEIPIPPSKLGFSVEEMIERGSVSIEKPKKAVATRKPNK